MKNLNIVLGKNGYISSNWRKGIKSSDKIIFANKIECNLLNKNSVNNFFKKYNNYDMSIFLLSAIVRKKVDNYQTYKKNIRMVKNLLSTIKKYKVSFLCFLSSTDIFEKNYFKAIKEKSYLSNNNFYAKYKIEAEKIIKKNFDKNKICIIRIPGIFGGIKDRQSTIYEIKSDIIKKKTIYYNESIRSYVFINDLVRFLNLVLIYKKNITINFCSNEKYYIYQIYKMIIKKLKFQRKFMKPNSNADGIFFDNKFFISHFPNFKFTKINKSLDIILKK